MRDDHSHFTVDNSDVCAHCGQPLRAPEPTYGERRPSRTGLIVTILLHLLLVAIYLYQPKNFIKKLASGGQPEIMYVLPQGNAKPKPQEQAPKKSPKTPKPKAAPERVQVQRLPNTITLPNEKPVEKPKAEPKREPIPENMDMQAYIEARKKQRGAQTPSDAPAESDNARAMRNALANVASVNARSNDDPNDTGGVFSITNKTFSSATLKFRGWNQNFKRRWLTQVTVELGGERDIETAIVRKMIELIRKEKKGDFEWESHRLNKVVTMSARPEDTEALQDFLYKEMFPEYKPPRG